MDYAHIRALHIACASLSITLFVLRGALQLTGRNWRRWRWLRIAPHVNDTVLLSAAVALALTSHQYPVAQPWLTAKVLALLVYIGIGGVALGADTPARLRVLAFVASLATVAYIVVVALTRSATWGWF